MSGMLTKDIQNPANTPFFDWVKAGRKTYEGRLGDKIKIWNLNIGGIIKFYEKGNIDNWVIVKITNLFTFKDFGMAYDFLGVQLMPELTREQVVEVYKEVFKNSLGTLKKHGVVAIGIEILYKSS